MQDPEYRNWEDGKAPSARPVRATHAMYNVVAPLHPQNMIGTSSSSVMSACTRIISRATKPP